MLVCAALPLKAQYTLRGTVTDSLTKEPLPYTSVYLKGTTEGGMTDNKGHFRFTTRRTQAQLTVSAVGYNEYTRTIRPATQSEHGGVRNRTLLLFVYGRRTVVSRAGAVALTF